MVACLITSRFGVQLLPEFQRPHLVMRESRQEAAECCQPVTDAATVFLLLLYCILNSLAEFLMKAFTSFRELIGVGVGVLIVADRQSTTSSGYRASLWDPRPDFMLFFFC
jgi:hypothetical protein